MQGSVGSATLIAVLAFFASAAGDARAQPANDDCADATVIGALPFTDSIDTTDATTEAGDPVFVCQADDDAPGPRSVWYRYTAASGTSLEISTRDSDYRAMLAAFTGSCGALGPVIACNTYDDHDELPDTEDARVVVTLEAGETAYIQVTDLNDDGGGTLELSASVTPVLQTSFDADDADYPDGAGGATGNFLVVWGHQGVSGRLVGSDGQVAGLPFQIGTGETYRPAVTGDGAGRFIVAWGNYDDTDVRAQRLSATGGALGGPIVVDGSYGGYAAVAADEDGDFVVVWEGAGIEARLFDAGGTPQAPSFEVTDYGRWPSVAMHPGGSFVVAWTDDDGSSYGVHARRFDASGTPLGAAFLVNTNTNTSQGDTGPGIAMDAAGNFVVVWSDHDYYNGLPGPAYVNIFGQRFDGAGTPVGGEFQVSVGTSLGAYSGAYLGTDQSLWPDVASDAAGNFVVVWNREYAGPYAREFDPDGTPLGPEFAVSHLVADYQYYTAAAAGPGGFLVVWDHKPTGSHDVALAHHLAPLSGPCPPAPAPGCRQQTIDFQGRLLLKNREIDKHDSLGWKWLRGEATAFADFGDPLTTTDYALCLYAPGLVQAASVPGGGSCGTKPCWKAKGSKGFTYRDRDGTADGIRKIVLKAGVEGKAKIVLKGQGEHLQPPSLPLTLPVTLQLQASNGTCWESRYLPEGVVKNLPGHFTAKPSVGGTTTTSSSSSTSSTSTSTSTTTSTIGSPSGAFVSSPTARRVARTSAPPAFPPRLG